MEVDVLAAPTLALRRTGAALATVPVVEYGRGGKRPFRHVQHLDDVATPGASHVRRLLRLPRDHASSQEQEEAGEEAREENKQVDVQLVLPEEDHSVGSAAVHLRIRRVDRSKRNVELGLPQLVLVLRQRQHQTIR